LKARQRKKNLKRDFPDTWEAITKRKRRTKEMRAKSRAFAKACQRVGVGMKEAANRLVEAFKGVGKAFKDLKLSPYQIELIRKMDEADQREERLLVEQKGRR